MTREQVLEISKELFKMPRYKNDSMRRAKLARRMYQLKREIAENAANVEATTPQSVP